MFEEFHKGEIWIHEEKSSIMDSPLLEHVLQLAASLSSRALLAERIFVLLQSHYQFLISAKN